MKPPLFNFTSLVLFALIGTASLFAQGTPVAANRAIVPVPRNDWLVMHEGFNEIARKGGVDVLFIGDSITYAWSNKGKAIWDERYAPLKAANFGIGGDRTQNVLWRLQNGNLAGIQPKVVVLLIGTNNLGSSSPEQVAEGITVIVNEIGTRSPGSKILLLGIFPRAEKPADSQRAKINQINTTIAKLDDGQRIHFLDIGQKFLQPDGSISKAIMEDFLHLSSAGYQIWADAIQPKLTELLK